MAKSIIQSYTFATVNTSLTQYGSLVSEPLWNATESLRQINLRPAGTLSRFSVRVSSNGITASTTIRTRVNSANGAQSVSIGSSATGQFTDTTNTDSITAGDDVNCQIVTGGSGTNIQVNIVAVEFEPTDSTKTVTKFGYINVPAFSTFLATRYYPLCGDSTSGNNTESDVDVLLRSAGALQYFEVRISANNRPAVTTYRTRVNGSNGAQSVSVSGSTTGEFEDTTNSDTIASGDVVSTQSVTGTGSGSITASCIGVSFVSTNTDLGIWLLGTLTGTSVAANATVYSTVQGDITFLSDSRSQISYNLDRTISNLIIQLSSNSITATSTCRFEKNITSTSLSVSIASSTTGYFEDTTNTASFLAGDIPTFKFIGGSSGTSAVVRKIYAQVGPLTSQLFEMTINESTITVGETLNRQLSANRTITESNVAITEDLDRQLFANRAMTEDAINVTDDLQGGLLFDREINEAAISVTEDLDRQLFANRSIDENVSVGETVDRILSAFRIINEAAINIDDSAEGHRLVERTITEDVIPVDETLEKTSFFFRTLTEPTISVGETLTGLLTIFRIITENTINVSDTLQYLRTTFGIINESTINVNETLVKTSFFFRTITESTINVTDDLDMIKGRFVVITEPSISVGETLTKSLLAFRIITEPTITVLESVNGTVPVKFIATKITDAGYSNPMRVRITFRSRKGDTTADSDTGEQIIYYRYDSYVPEDRPFNLIAFNLKLTQGEIGVAAMDIEDHAENIDDTRKISFKSIVEIDFKKELGRDWERMMTGFVRRIRTSRPATGALIYSITVLTKQVIYGERITDFKRAAKRTNIDSSVPLSTDKKMEAHNLFKELHTATDAIPLKRPTIQETGEFDLTTGSISNEVTDFIAEIGPGLTTASEVPNALSEVTGAIWGVDPFGNPFFRYPTEKHSGIIIKDDPQNDDSAINTSINMDSFEFEDTIDVAEGFANRIYVLNSKDTSSTASSSKASGKTSLTTRWIAQSFIAEDNNVTGGAFILSKVGNPTNSSGTIQGQLRTSSNNGRFPTGSTLATFEISITEINTSQSVIFVNDIKHPQGSIVPGQKYWWVLKGTGLFDDTHTIFWHHDNDLVTPDRPFSSVGPQVDTDPTKPGLQFIWQTSETGPVYAFSTFSSINHVLTQSDSESIKEFGLIEAVVNLPAFGDDATFQKALVKILQTSAKLKRVYDYARVTIPTAKFFLPGELVTVIDSKAKLLVEKIINAEIVEVNYNFDMSSNALGCKYVDIRMIGFIDPVLDEYLANVEC